MIDLDRVGAISAATADFFQKNIPGVRSSRVKGKLLENGNFIFSWEDGSHRKMILTENDGKHILNGYMKRNSVDESNWKDTTNWKSKSADGFYFIKNFAGNAGVLLLL